MTPAQQRALQARFGDALQIDALLAPMTTFKVGGPADALLEVHTSGELLNAIKAAAQIDVPATVLGGGSNVLIGDRGIRGLVVRTRGGEIASIDEQSVRADAGVTINGLVRWTVARGLSSVEAWAGTPGTVGGAIFGNAHWNRVNIGDLVSDVALASPAGTPVIASGDDMGFSYDDSRLKHSGEVLLTSTFRVIPGKSPDELRAVARESLHYRKRTQPLQSPSAGCIFMNPDPDDPALPPDVPASAGALVERAGLKGERLGRVRISPTHANFIVNESGATAADIRELIDRARAAVQQRFGISLREEIVYMGEF